MIERGNWLQTHTGRQFWPCDPDPADVSLIDIAHALALQCRFGGHCSTFYSVAEHCVRVSRVVPPEDALAGLFHDAAEAYVVDIPRPLKRHSAFNDYRIIEDRVHHAICVALKLPWEIPASVKLADNRMLMTEKRDLVARTDFVWTEAQAHDGSADPYPDTIYAWSWAVAESYFLARYREIMRIEAPRRVLDQTGTAS